jgi:hypothetical protein
MLESTCWVRVTSFIKGEQVTWAVEALYFMHNLFMLSFSKVHLDVLPMVQESKVGLFNHRDEEREVVVEGEMITLIVEGAGEGRIRDAVTYLEINIYRLVPSGIKVGSCASDM